MSYLDLTYFYNIFHCQSNSNFNFFLLTFNVNDWIYLKNLKDSSSKISPLLIATFVGVTQVFHFKISQTFISAQLRIISNF